MKSEDILFFLKMSIFQFFLKMDFSFYSKDREVIFDLLTNDKKINTQNKIIITEDDNLIILSCIAIKKEFLDISELMIIANFINEFSGFFSCYVQEILEEDFSLFYIKTPIFPEKGTCIDENFWKKQITIQINNVSIITDFLFFKFPNSKFFINKEINSEEFKNFLLKSIKSYIEDLKLIREKENEIDYEDLNKEEIGEAIDEELKKYSKGEGDIEKLNKLSQAFFKK